MRPGMLGIDVAKGRQWWNAWKVLLVMFFKFLNAPVVLSIAVAVLCCKRLMLLEQRLPTELRPIHNFCFLPIIQRLRLKALETLIEIIFVCFRLFRDCLCVCLAWINNVCMRELLIYLYFFLIVCGFYVYIIIPGWYTLYYYYYYYYRLYILVYACKERWRLK